MKKDNKGFTLIELLITIAMMITILLISIRSISSLNRRKKSEAKKVVEEEIISAAEQYVDANEYLFTDKELNNGAIYLKELIEKGYLNKVIDPSTGEAYNECSKVNISIVNGDIKVTGFDDTGDNSCSYNTFCSGDLTIKTDFVRADKGKLGETHNGWYNAESLNGSTLALNITLSGDGTDSFTLTKDGKPLNVNSNSYTDTETFKNDGIYEVEYTVKANNKICKVSVGAKIDTKAPASPTIEMKLKKTSNAVRSNAKFESLENGEYKSNEWTNKRVVARATDGDDNEGGSGFAYYKSDISTSENRYDGKSAFRNIDEEGITTLKYVSCDKAGNCSEESDATIKLDRTPPTEPTIAMRLKNSSAEITSRDAFENLTTRYSSGVWKNKWVVARVYGSSDSLSRFNRYEYKSSEDYFTKAYRGFFENVDAEGTTTLTYRACDNANNCSDDVAVQIKLDRTPPTTWVIDKRRSLNVKGTKCSGTNIFHDFGERETKNGGTVETVKKRGLGNFAYSQRCTDSISGIAEKRVRWDLRKTSSKFKGTSADTEGRSVNENDYDGRVGAYSFAGALNGETIVYARYCVDNAGNRSDTFKIEIKADTENYPNCN